MRRVDRDAVADLVLIRHGTRRSSWNVADIRGEASGLAFDQPRCGVAGPLPGRVALGHGLGRRHCRSLRRFSCARTRSRVRSAACRAAVFGE